MARIIAYVKALLAEEPAVTAWLLSGGLAMLVAYVFHWGHTEQAAAATVVTALAALYSALMARPAHIQVAVGILGTLITAAATFGLHVSAHAESAVLAGASIVLAFLFRQNIEPVALARKRAGAERAAALREF